MIKFPDIVFVCRKCNHELFIDKQQLRKIVSLIKIACPNCGEEDEIWILSREGNFEKEYGGKQ